MRISNTSTPSRLGVCSLVTLALSASTALAQTTDFIGKFSGPTSLNNSVLFQSGPQIGLGTTTPLDFMSIRFDNTGGGRTGLALQNTNGSATSYSGALMYDHLGATAVFQGFNNNTKEYRINNVASGGTINFLQGANSRFYVDGSGNVGIGTQTPDTKFDVNGNAVLSGGGRSLYVSGITTAGQDGLRLHHLSGNSYIDFKGPGNLYFRGDNSLGGTEQMVITGTGRVGIGNSNPTQSKVVISGIAGTFESGNYGYLRSGGAGDTSGTSIFPTRGPSSLYASGTIAANDFLAFSDERIKNIRGRSDSATDLATLSGIEVSDYTYRDTYGKGSGKEKKVVAQQVEQVFPQAVSRSADALPDIYKPAAFKDGWVSLATDLKVGDRVKLIGKETEGTYEVLEVADGKFRTDFKTGSDRVFVYGREVNDFRSVDYDAIAMLNVSATQELHRRLEKEAAVNAEQAARIAELEQSRQAQASELAALKQQMSQILAATQVRTANARAFRAGPRADHSVPRDPSGQTPLVSARRRFNGAASHRGSGRNVHWLDFRDRAKNSTKQRCGPSYFASHKSLRQGNSSLMSSRHLLPGPIAPGACR